MKGAKLAGLLVLVLLIAGSVLYVTWLAEEGKTAEEIEEMDSVLRELEAYLSLEESENIDGLDEVLAV